MKREKGKGKRRPKTSAANTAGENSADITVNWLQMDDKSDYTGQHQARCAYRQYSILIVH